jgi:hypothetical protein
MLVESKCMYGNKCKYAHNLKSQYVKPINKYIYDAIIKNTDLSHIDLSENIKMYDFRETRKSRSSSELYDRLLVMTNLCENCSKRKCHGGYNCKNGAIDEMFVICYNDLIGGNCNNTECTHVHLTKQYLKPYNRFTDNSNNADSDSDIEENVAF